MMNNPDEAYVLTEKRLETLEKRIANVYRQAYEEKQKSVDEYFEKLAKDDERMKALVEKGKMTEKMYKQWRQEEYFKGELYKKMRDELAERMTHANEIAMAYVNDETPSIYSINRNWSSYEIESQVGDCNFMLFDEQTVKRLIVDNPELMPNYPEEKAVKRGIDLAYGKQQIEATITSGILQGNTIIQIATDLKSRMPTMNMKMAIRAARTSVTAAQNAGRIDGYSAAEKMGIKLKKQWMATLDSRTRHSHAMLDGVAIANEKVFDNGCRYPGDPNGSPEEIYNCRCTLIALLDDAPYQNAERRARSTATGKNYVIKDMTYEEWENGKKIEHKTIAKPVQSGTIKEAVNIPKVYQQFESGDAVNDFFYYDGENRGLLARKNSQHGKWMQSLSDDERNSISDYTGVGYYDLNNYLRKTGNWQSIDPQKEEYLASNIDSAISRYRLKDNIRVQRGVMEDALDELISQYGDNRAELIGKTYHDDGYMSTTAMYGNSTATAKPVIFEIDIPAGTGRGAYVNQLAGQYQDTEYEFLLARGSKFTITGIEENNEPIPPQTIIKMRMIVDE